MKEWKHPDKFPRSDFRSARRPSNSAATSFFSLCPRWAGVSVGRHCPRTVFPIFPRFLLVVLHSVFPSPLRHEAFGIHSPVVTSFGGGAGATPRFKRADPGPSRGTQPRCVAFRTHLLRPGLGACTARAREATRVDLHVVVGSSSGKRRKCHIINEGETGAPLPPEPEHQQGRPTTTMSAPLPPYSTFRTDNKVRHAAAVPGAARAAGENVHVGRSRSPWRRDRPSVLRGCTEDTLQLMVPGLVRKGVRRSVGPPTGRTLGGLICISAALWSIPFGRV